MLLLGAIALPGGTAPAPTDDVEPDDQYNLGQVEPAAVPSTSWRQGILWQTIEEPDAISGSPGLIAISPDDRLVASVIDPVQADPAQEIFGDAVRVWDLITGEVRYTLADHDASITAIAFSPDGETLATASYNHDRRMLTIHLWDAATGERRHSLFRAVSPRLYSGAYYFRAVLAFSPDGKTLYSSTTYPIIQVWDVEQGTLIRSLVPYREVVRAIAVSPDGRTLASSHVDGTWSLFDLQEEGTISRIHVGRDGFDIAFMPDGSAIMGAFEFSVNPNRNQRQVLLWDVASGTILRQLPNFSDQAWLVPSPDGQVFASSIYGEGVEIRNLPTNQVLLTLDLASSNYAFSPSGQIFAVATEGEIQIWQRTP